MSTVSKISFATRCRSSVGSPSKKCLISGFIAFHATFTGQTLAVLVKIVNKLPLAILFILSTVLATGCSSPWYRAGSTERDYYREEAQCEMEYQQTKRQQFYVGAAPAVGLAMTGEAIGEGFQRRNYVNDCLRAKGWQPHPPKPSKPAN